MTYGMPQLVNGDTRRFMYLVHRLVKNSVQRTSMSNNNTIKILFYCSDALTDWNSNYEEPISLLNKEDIV